MRRLEKVLDKMGSSHRRHILKEVASKERNVDSDVIARIALDEIDELEQKLDKALTNAYTIEMTASPPRKKGE